MNNRNGRVNKLCMNNKKRVGKLNFSCRISKSLSIYNTCTFNIANFNESQI